MKRRAFTLVELLVVIAIIGLLSTVAVVATNASRVQARDVKRKTDLRQISQAVEMYGNDHGWLPWAVPFCGRISALPNGPSFVVDITPYMPHVPLDPTKANQTGDYLYKNVDNKSQYVLCANLEQATANSYNYSSCQGGSVYNYCIAPNGGT